MKLPILSVAAAAAMLLFSAETRAADKVAPDGTWTWTMTTPNGQTRTNHLKLKLEGDKLTGSVSGRNGDTAIDGAKLEEDKVSFSVTRERDGNKFTQKYSGKISGDTIKGKIEFEREGQAQSRDWEAKREEAKK